MRRVRNAFVTGLLVLVPLLATIDILRWFFRFIDLGVRNYLPPLPWDFSGLGILIGVSVVLTTGILTQNFIGTWLVSKFDHIIRHFPLVGGIYIAIKRFMETIFSPNSNQFKRAVILEFPREGLYSVGFLTGEPDPKLHAPTKKKLVNVFIPLVPNPISGFYLLVPESEITPLDLTVQEAFRMVVSMGIVKSDELPKELQPKKRPGRPRKLK